MLNVNVEKVEKAISEVANQIIVPRFRKLADGDIAYKIGDDPVTIADKEAEKALSKRLLDLLPGSNVVGEENFAENPSISNLFLGDQPVWVIDPIDGTRAFVAGKPFYGVIVALTKQNQTLAGWLYDPTSKEFITAEKGAGAFHKGERLSVLPSSQTIEDMRGVLGFAIVEEFKANGIAFAPDGRPAVLPGASACHDFPRLVAGNTHFSRQFEQMHFYAWRASSTPWDLAAGLLIHAEAGGYAAMWDGKELLPSYFGCGFLAAPDKSSWEKIKIWVENRATSLTISPPDD